MSSVIPNKAPTHFTIFETLFTKKRIYSDEIISKLYDPFLSNRQLMAFEDFVFTANNLNAIQITPLQHYNTLFATLPLLKRAPFLKFMNTVKKNNEMIKKIASYYKTSYRVASGYLFFVDRNVPLREEIEFRWAEKNGTLKEYFKKHK